MDHWRRVGNRRRRYIAVLLVLAAASGGCGGVVTYGEGESDAPEVDRNAISGLASCSPVSESLSEVDTSPGWLAGEQRSFVVRSETVHWREERNESTEWPMLISVIEELDNGWRLEAETSFRLLSSYHHVQFGIDEEGIAELESLGRVKVSYETDVSGTYRGTMNVSSIKDQLEPLFVWYEVHAATLSSEDESVLLGAVEFARNSGTLIGSVIEDLRVYHALYGRAMTPGQYSMTTTELDNGIGGPDIPAREKTGIAESADAGGCVTFEIDATMDPTNAGSIIAATIRALGADEGFADEVEDAGSDFHSESLSLYQWDPSVGWFVSIGSQRLTSISGYTTLRTKTIVVDR